jgi:hypothetical protein
MPTAAAMASKSGCSAVSIRVQARATAAVFTDMIHLRHTGWMAVSIIVFTEIGRTPFFARIRIA